VALSLVASCNVGDGSGDTSTSLSPHSLVASSPIDDFIRAETGASLAQMNAATLDRRGDVVRVCMSDRGFEVAEWEVPTGDIVGSSPVTLGGISAQALRQIDAAATDVQSAPADDDSARQAALGACYELARDVPDPSVDLLSWILAETADIDATVKSSLLLEGLRQERQACLVAAGVPDGDVDALAAGVAAEVDDILNDYIGQVLSESAARDRLAAVRQREEALAAEVSECDDPLDQAEADLRNALEKGWVEQNGAALREQLAAVESILAEMSDYLSRRTDD